MEREGDMEDTDRDHKERIKNVVYRFQDLYIPKKVAYNARVENGFRHLDLHPNKLQVQGREIVLGSATLRVSTLLMVVVEETE